MIFLFFKHLSSLQQRFAIFFVIAGLLIAGAGYSFVQKLKLNTDWTALLPDDRPSVHDLKIASKRLAATATLAVMVQSQDLEAMQAFTKDLVPKLNALPRELVSSVDWNVSAYQDFIAQHRHLYVGTKELSDIRDALDERLEYELSRANPFFVDLEGNAPESPQALIDKLKAKDREHSEKNARYPGGFFVHPNRDLIAIFVRSNPQGGALGGGQKLLERVEAAVQELKPQHYAKDMHVEFTGDIVMAKEEHDAVRNELITAIGLTVALVLFVIWLFFRRFRVLPLLAISVGIPVIVTFGLAQILVEYLNSSSAFLGSIVIGNGINPQVIWLARYFELRRFGTDVPEAVKETHRSTWIATLTSSAGAAVAYGSLMISEFRGFRDFGVIGCTGMLLCWVSMATLLPALVVLSERIRPLRWKTAPKANRIYSAWLEHLVFKAPRAILIVSGIFTVLSLIGVVVALINDPREYDFRNLRSVRDESTRARVLSSRVGEIISSGAKGDGIVLLTESRSEAQTLRQMLEKKRDTEHAPWGPVRSIEDLLPSDQTTKHQLLGDIRALLLRLRKYGSEAQQQEIDANLPPEHFSTLDVADLPEDVARLYTEQNGSRGRIVIVEKKPGPSIWDGRYLVEWSNSLRQISLPNGKHPVLAGRAPVFADMLQVIWHDGPITLTASLVTTLLLIAFAFRRFRERWLVSLAMIVGGIWMAGMMVVLRTRINFLNFVAFPITFGIGVDYAVNVIRRYIEEEPKGREEGIRAALADTGSAVVLNSLTTIIGYITMFTSANKALNSFGAAMTISEVTCLSAAVLSLPAMLLILAKKPQQRP